MDSSSHCHPAGLSPKFGFCLPMQILVWSRLKTRIRIVAPTYISDPWILIDLGLTLKARAWYVVGRGPAAVRVAGFGV